MTGEFCTSRTDSSAEFEEPFKVERFTGCPVPTEVDSRHQRDVRAGFRFGREPRDRAIDHSDYAVDEVPRAMSSPEPAISTQTIGFCSSVQLTECSDIDNFFQSEKAQHYVKWFNATLANKLSWAVVSLVDTPQNDIGFHRFWNRIDQIFGGTQSGATAPPVLISHSESPSP